MTRELIIITNKGRILREYPDSWQYPNKDLSKLIGSEEVVIALISEVEKRC